MCGIVGSVNSLSDSWNWVKNSVYLIKHRGPDDNGFFNGNNFCFGMCRLSVIDIDGGTQPVHSNDGRFTLIFNGQIYNFKEIRSTLEKLGHEFKTKSDSEVILQGYIEFQEHIVKYLEGMFAFAIWDSLNQSLFLARDRFGEKPMCYSQISSGGIIFASEIKALLDHPDVSIEPDLGSIQLMLNFGYIPSPRSAYKEIYKVPPGHYLEWRNNGITLTKYWQPATQQVLGRSEDDLISELDNLLLNSVQSRMNSDRGVGAWLSGGVDSSLVTHYMSQVQDSPVETFSAGFENQQFDESDYALAISKHLNTSHHPILVKFNTDEDLLGVIDQLDEPFADSSFFATFILSRFTAEHKVVVLGGDGGDEAFGGYDRYRFVKLVHEKKWISPLILGLSKLLDSSKFQDNSTNILRKLNKLSKYNKNSVETYESMMTWITKQEIRLLLGNDYNNDLSLWFQTQLNQISSSHRSVEFFANLWDVLSYLPGDLLPKTDMASMAFGLEVRSPFLDSNVFSFGLSLPDNMRVKENDGKYLLKQLARRKLPNMVVDRPKKGFAIPREEWLRGILNKHLKYILSSKNSILGELIDLKHANSRLELFQSGAKNDAEIWCLYMLGIWANRWL